MIDWKQFCWGLMPTAVIAGTQIGLVALVWAVATLDWGLGLALALVLLIPALIIGLMLKSCLRGLYDILRGR